MSDNAAPVIVLTRAKPQSERFAQDCRDRFGADVEIAILPLQAIEPVAQELDLADAGSLVFTSENAARITASLTDRRDLPCYCVGDRTATAARGAGFAATSAGGTAKDLAALIRAAGVAEPIVHLHGRHLAVDLVTGLRDAGLNARGQVIYDQVALAVPAALTDLVQSGRPLVVPLFSPRSARLFADAIGTVRPDALHLVCISAKVRAALPEAMAGTADVAATPEAEAMLSAMLRHISP